jgi:excisionase family DNA binding protein
MFAMPMTFIGKSAGTAPDRWRQTMDIEKRAFSIDEFCRRYGVGRTTAYEEIKAKRLQVAKAGKRTLVTADAAESWLKSLPTSRAAS